jgi:predicted dienelactone hydrolase
LDITATRRAVLLGLGPAALARPALALDRVEIWADPARRRAVPVRVRLPATEGLPAPVVVISHGLGGTRDGLAYLGAALAEAGFVAVHVQHVGTDAAVWRGVAEPMVAMAAAVLDVGRAIDRLHDIAFVLETLPHQAALRGRIDMARVAIAGHSYGAWTVTHMLGERLPGGALLEARVGLALPAPQLRAGVALSPVPPLGMPPDLAYGRVQAPILHVTGTQDRGHIEAATPEDRLIPFRHIAAPGVLVVLQGAGHAAFAGEAAAGPRWNEPTFHDRTARAAVLFLRAVLLRDAAAGALLLRGTTLGPGDRIESKGTLVQDNI